MICREGVIKTSWCALSCKQQQSKKCTYAVYCSTSRVARWLFPKMDKVFRPSIKCTKSSIYSPYRRYFSPRSTHPLQHFLKYDQSVPETWKSFAFKKWAARIIINTKHDKNKPHNRKTTDSIKCGWLFDICSNNNHLQGK